MSLEVVIQANTTAIRDLIAALSKGAPIPSAPVVTVAPESKVLEFRAKTEDKTPESDSAPVEQTPGNDVPAATAPTYQEAAAAIIGLSRKKGRDAAIAVLGKFKATNLPGVKPEDFAALIAAANAAAGE